MRLDAIAESDPENRGAMAANGVWYGKNIVVSSSIIIALGLVCYGGLNIVVGLVAQ
jgi:hypothetical protein